MFDVIVTAAAPISDVIVTAVRFGLDAAGVRFGVRF